MNSFTSRSTRLRLAQLLVLAAVPAATAAAGHAQNAPQAQTQTQAPDANQYTGVSNPPADDTIVANDDAAAPASKPMPGVAAAPAASTPAPAPAATIAPQAAAPPAPLENPDYGVVTSTDDSPTPGVAGTDTDRSAHLVSRPTNPDYGVVGMVPSPSNQLAEGTDIRVRLLQPLSTTRSQDGQEFRAQVAADVYKEGRVVIPMGAELRGRVMEVTQGHRMGAHATIRLRPDAVILPDGTAYHLYAQAIESSAPGTKTDDEGGIQTTDHVMKDLAEYGAGTGGGAVVGGVLGGPVGAGAGAIVGASLVTTHLLLQKPAQANIAEGSELVFSLTEPMDLVPTRN